MRIVGPMLIALMMLVTSPASGGGEPPTSAEAAGELRTLISERLAVMPGVAKFKYNRDIPVEDLGREKVILEGLVKKAKAAGVSPVFADMFFKDQITAAKMIQNRLIQEWRAETHPKFTDVPDLKAEVRPALDRLTGRILAKIAALQSDPRDPSALDLLKMPTARWASEPDIWAQATGSLERLTAE